MILKPIISRFVRPIMSLTIGPLSDYYWTAIKVRLTERADITSYKDHFASTLPTRLLT